MRIFPHRYLREEQNSYQLSSYDHQDLKPGRRPKFAVKHDIMFYETQ